MADLEDLVSPCLSKRQIAKGQLRQAIAKATRAGSAKGMYLHLDPHARAKVDEARRKGR
jgi:hypothetical protein